MSNEIAPSLLMKVNADGKKFKDVAAGTGVIWFTCGIEVYGTYFNDDGNFSVIDVDGYPFDEKWLNENYYELIEVLKAAYKIHAA